MIPRRQLLGLPAVGGLLGLFGARAAAADPLAAAQQLTDRSMDGIVRAIESLRDEMRSERSFTEIRRIRDAQKEHLRVNTKLPDFIEVGMDVWFGIHDWHIKWQQPMSLGRDAGGRYTIVLLQTVVILRTDMMPSYIGVPFDGR